MKITATVEFPDLATLGRVIEFLSTQHCLTKITIACHNEKFKPNDADKV